MEQMDRRTGTISMMMTVCGLRRVSAPFEMVKAGLHWSRRMSRQILPLELMFG
jgi:hypothetical protein